MSHKLFTGAAAQLPTLWNGLQGYWALNETTGATVVYPTYGSVTGTPSNVTWEAGKNQNCVKFDGTNTSNTSLINFGVVSQYSYEYTQPWSWSMWIKRTRQGSVLDCLICNLELSIVTGCFDMYIFNNLVYINIWQTSTKYVSNVSSTAFWTDTTSWHHLVFTYNGNNAQSGILGYYDGTSITWGTGKASNINGTIVNTGNLYFGERSTQGAKILFDEAGLWNRVLTTTEITELYNSGSGKFY